MKQSQATLLVDQAMLFCALLHTRDGEPFALVKVDDREETWPLRSRGIRRWLAALFQQEFGRVPNAQAINDAMSVLEAHAMRGQEAELHVRLAAGSGGGVALDLGDRDWTAISIGPAGWRAVSRGRLGVCFRRPQGLLPLPMPAEGGDLAELREFVNVGSDDDFALLVGWLVGTLRASGPYPVLVLQGEQGSAKSTAARVFRALVDPNLAALRAEPREPRDLMIASRNGWVIALDNISMLKPWLSDNLCRLATGGGFATRTLYSDYDETIIDAQRPVLLNGIDSVATRSDLVDRSIMVTLPRIGDDRRRRESELWERFQTARPRLLGALLDAVVVALQREGSIQLERLPRLADFATWVAAAEPALPWPEGTFLRAYAESRASANNVVIESSLIAPMILILVAEGPFAGTSADLLTELEKLLPERKTRSDEWPKTARGLSAELRRVAPNLRAAGLVVEQERGPGRRRARLWRLEMAEPKDPGSDRPNRPHRPNGSDSEVLASDGRADGWEDGPASDRPNGSTRDGCASDGADDSDGSDPAISVDLLSIFREAGVRVFLGADGALRSEPAPADLAPELFDVFLANQAELREALA